MLLSENVFQSVLSGAITFFGIPSKKNRKLYYSTVAFSWPFILQIHRGLTCARFSELNSSCCFQYNISFTLNFTWKMHLTHLQERTHRSKRSSNFVGNTPCYDDKFTWDHTQKSLFWSDGLLEVSPPQNKKVSRVVSSMRCIFNFKHTRESVFNFCREVSEWYAGLYLLESRTTWV